MLLDANTYAFRTCVNGTKLFRWYLPSLDNLAMIDSQQCFMLISVTAADAGFHRGTELPG